MPISQATTIRMTSLISSTNINFNANPWNITTASQTPPASIDPTLTAAVAAMDPVSRNRLIEVGMDPIDAARVAAMDPAISQK